MDSFNGCYGPFGPIPSQDVLLLLLSIFQHTQVAACHFQRLTSLCTMTSLRNCISSCSTVECVTSVASRYVYSYNTATTADHRFLTNHLILLQTSLYSSYRFLLQQLQRPAATPPPSQLAPRIFCKLKRVIFPLLSLYHFFYDPMSFHSSQCQLHLLHYHQLSLPCFTSLHLQIPYESHVSLFVRTKTENKSWNLHVHSDVLKHGSYEWMDGIPKEVDEADVLIPLNTVVHARAQHSGEVRSIFIIFKTEDLITRLG